MKNIINRWIVSKKKNFNYIEALKTLVKNQSLENQSIEDYLHFNFDIEDDLEKIKSDNEKYINDILDLINRYFYYLEMNKILISQDTNNIKKLIKLNQILDTDFLDFLDRNLDLDKTILSSNDSLKIVDNYQDVIKYYLEYDFKFALNELEKTFTSSLVNKGSIEIKDKDITVLCSKVTHQKPFKI